MAAQQLPLQQPCHDSSQPILTLGKATVYAGGSRDLDICDDWSLVVNFSGYSDNSPFAHAWGQAGKLCKGFMKAMDLQYQYLPELEIYWGDGKAPELTLDEWKALITDISKVKGKVFLHCVGGHGRTGTALAVIAHLTNMNYGDHEGIVQFLRASYCEKIVETTKQTEYLKSIGVANVPEHEPIYAGQVGYKWPQPSIYTFDSANNLPIDGWCYHCGFKNLKLTDMFQYDATGYGLCQYCVQKGATHDTGTGEQLP